MVEILCGVFCLLLSIQSVFISGGQKTTEKAEERRGCRSEKSTRKDGCRQGKGESARGGQEEGGSGSRCSVCARAFLQEVGGVGSCVLHCGDRPNVESRGRSTTQRLLEPTTVLGPTAFSLVVTRRCSSGSSTSGGGFGVLAQCSLGLAREGRAIPKRDLPTCVRFLFLLQSSSSICWSCNLWKYFWSGNWTLFSPGAARQRQGAIRRKIHPEEDKSGDTRLLLTLTAVDRLPLGHEACSRF